ncbi:hypothetical protein KSU1_C0482 [Candidatus Jettenia caeni]|uniref:Uncharacterized protein n=1 Tax=Candidatus Jettenia caeni TaxID=247490 RepID=I3IK33_9BACT|nr:hypothetical protein KSU1_C0482 [Candidatus Jettenia caeni]
MTLTDIMGFPVVYLFIVEASEIERQLSWVPLLNAALLVFFILFQRRRCKNMI